MLASALTDKGKVRTINQDCLFSFPEQIGNLNNLFMVADGMGGHKAGDIASNFLIENLAEYVRRADGKSPVGILKKGILDVNNRLYDMAVNDNNLYGMGSTLVAATISDGVLYTANVGDSRLYIIRDGAAIQVTKDHSFVEEMVSIGQMERYSENYQNKKNIITRAVGMEPGVNADFFENRLQNGDYILLCSDGLTNMVSEDEISSIVMAPGLLNHKVKHLIAEANENGGKDNIAVILVNPMTGEVNEC